MLDTTQAAQEVLRALRGPRSQVAFSRRLSYRSNVAANWEQGRRFPTAGEFLRACRVVDLDVVAAFTRFHAAAAPALGPGDDEGVAAWLSTLRGATPEREVAARTGASRHALGRWLSGKTRPRLPAFLGLVDALTGRVQDLVGELVPIAHVPALAERVARADAARDVFSEEPWAVPVLLLVETAAYQALSGHSDAWLAGALGLPHETVATCVRRLVTAGLLEAGGDRLVPGESLTIDTRTQPEVRRRMKRHWLQVGSERIGQERPSDILAYNVFAVSDRDLDTIRGLQRRFFRQVRAIVAASEPCESVALLNLQLLTWEPPDGP